MGQDYARERLGLAFHFLLLLQEDDLPKALRPEFRAVVEELTPFRAVGKEEAMLAPPLALSNKDASHLASRILSLYLDLRGGL